MKKLYPLLSVLFLIYWGCEEETPTEVTLWGVVYSVENTTNLNLQSHGLTGEIPPEIGDLINLEILRLGRNELTGSIPPEIGNLTNLTQLFLNSNQLRGTIPPEIWNLTNLNILWLDWNQLTGTIPPEIGNLTNLYYLWLTNNQLTGEVPESICDLNVDFNSNHFNISNNQLCPPYPNCIHQNDINNQDTTDCP